MCQQYPQCVVSTMIVWTITRVVILFILWSNIKEVHTNGPRLNTLFVDIGQLYPRADFAGVLIDLNVDQAITRGKAALNLTDYFLQHSYNKPKQIIGKWTGANRNIHFLALKRRQVQHNLNILTTDLYHVTEQYRIPGFKQQTPKTNPKHKPKQSRAKQASKQTSKQTNKTSKADKHESRYNITSTS